MLAREDLFWLEALLLNRRSSSLVSKRLLMEFLHVCVCLSNCPMQLNLILTVWDSVSCIGHNRVEQLFSTAFCCPPRERPAFPENELVAFIFAFNSHFALFCVVFVCFYCGLTCFRGCLR